MQHTMQHEVGHHVEVELTVVFPSGVRDRLAVVWRRHDVYVFAMVSIVATRRTAMWGDLETGRNTTATVVPSLRDENGSPPQQQ
jgi:hypothetical protein